MDATPFADRDIRKGRLLLFLVNDGKPTRHYRLTLSATTSAATPGPACYESHTVEIAHERHPASLVCTGIISANPLTHPVPSAWQAANSRPFRRTTIGNS